MELLSFLMDLGMEWNLILLHVLGLLKNWQDTGVLSHGEAKNFNIRQMWSSIPFRNHPPLLLTLLCLTSTFLAPCLLSTVHLLNQLQNSHLCPVYCPLDVSSQANSRLQSLIFYNL